MYTLHVCTLPIYTPHVHFPCTLPMYTTLLMYTLNVHSVGIPGHAVAEAPTGVARALLYIVRGSPSFLLSFLINHQSYKLFYHTFHQVMSPGRRAYSLKSILLYCILLRSFTSYHHKFAARKSRNDKMQRGLVSYNNDHQPSASNQQPNATRYHSVVNGMIILCSQ